MGATTAAQARACTVRIYYACPGDCCFDRGAGDTWRNAGGSRRRYSRGHGWADTVCFDRAAYHSGCFLRPVEANVQAWRLKQFWPATALAWSQLAQWPLLVVEARRQALSLQW